LNPAETEAAFRLTNARGTVATVRRVKKEKFRPTDPEYQPRSEEASARHDKNSITSALNGKFMKHSG
jgi:hypothetical protein